MDAFKAYFKGIQLVYDDLFLLVGISLVWTVAALPLYFVSYWVYATRDIIPVMIFFIIILLAIPPLLIGPATAGLYRVAHELANERRADMSMFWEAARQEWKPGWRTMVASIALLVLILGEIVASINLPGAIRYLTLLWVYALILWVALQVYLFPFLAAQEAPRTWWALRNAALTALANPIFTLILLVLLGLTTALSVVLPILLVMLWPGAVALITSRALVMIIEKLPKPKPDEPSGHLKE